MLDQNFEDRCRYLMAMQSLESVDEAKRYSEEEVEIWYRNRIRQSHRHRGGRSRADQHQR